jgi:nitroreductase
MNAIEAILTRRSIRKFKNTKVSAEDIKLLLTAAMSAPTAFGMKHLRFVVLDHDENGITDKIMVINQYAQMVKTAPISILVCGERSNDETMPDFRGVDCAAAVENILVAANAIGLGSVWTAVYPMEDRVKKFRDVCGLPDSIMPHTLVVLGYPDEKKEKPNPYNEDFVFYNVWKSK